MKTIHHVIVTAMDAGMPVDLAIDIANKLFSERVEPMKYLDMEIATLDDAIRELTSRLNALREIRTKYSVNGVGVSLREARLREPQV